MSDDKDLVQKLTKLVSEARKPSHASVGLGLMFPKAQSALDVYDGGLQGSNPVLSHRISRREFAAAYFGLSATSASWAKSDLERLIKSENPSSTLNDLLLTIDNLTPSLTERAKLRGQLIKVIEDGINSEELKLNAAWLQAIFRASPLFIKMRDTKSSGWYRVSNDERLRWLILKPMRDMPAQTRSDLMYAAIEDLDDFSLPCEVFRALAGDILKDAAKGLFGDAAFGSETNNLRVSLVDRARKLAGSGTMWLQALPENILWFWRNAGYVEEVRSFIREEIEEGRNIQSILALPITEVVSTAGNYFQVQKSWELLVDLDLLDAVASELARADDDRGRAAREYLGAREKRKEQSF